MTSLIIHPLSSTPSMAEKKEAQEAMAAGNGFLEMLNPLQHIPVVSHIYRGTTGTDIPAVAKIMGGGLFGGVVGAVGSAAVSVAEEIAGQPMLEMAQEMVEKPINYLPTTPSSPVVHTLQPDEGQAYLSLLETMAIPTATSSPSVVSPPAPRLRELDALRRSAVGLPQENIEAQLHHQLHKETVELL